MKAIKAFIALSLSISSVLAHADLISANNQGMIKAQSCSADDLSERMEEAEPKPFVFENDPYQLKKIHFNLLVMDLNDDGILTKEEIKKTSPRSIGYWNKYDIDNDGSITGPEVKSYIETLLLDQWRRKYISLDRDRDGEIKEKDLNRIYYAYTDVINVKDIMKEYDINSNGVISITEYFETSKNKIRLTNIQ
jgi:hypothetical protein